MRVHAAAEVREVEHGAVGLGDEQLRGVGLPEITHAGRLLTALVRDFFAVLVVNSIEFRLTVHSVHNMITNRRNNNLVNRRAQTVDFNRLTGRQLDRAVPGLQLKLEAPCALGDSCRLTVFTVQHAQVAERDLNRAASLHRIVVRHGFDILDGVVARVFVIEVAAAGRTVHAASDGAVRTLPVQVIQTGIRVFRAVERAAVVLFQRVGDKVVVTVEQDRVRRDGHAVRGVARTDGTADLVDDLGVRRRAEHTGKDLAR